MDDSLKKLIESLKNLSEGIRQARIPLEEHIEKTIRENPESVRDFFSDYSIPHLIIELEYRKDKEEYEVCKVISSMIKQLEGYGLATKNWTNS